jgi:hypothetical protein
MPIVFAVGGGKRKQVGRRKKPNPFQIHIRRNDFMKTKLKSKRRVPAGSPLVQEIIFPGSL